MSWLKLLRLVESTLVKEMSDQSKFLQGDKSEFLGNKQ